MPNLPDAPILRWSTSEIQPCRRFEYFADMLSRAIIPMAVGHANLRAYNEEVEVAGCGPLSVIHNSGGPHLTYRDKRELGRSQERSFHLLTSLKGRWKLEHCGRNLLRPGDVILVDSRFANLIETTAPYEILNLKLPPAWVETWLPDPAPLVGRTIARSSPWGRPLSLFVSQLLPDRIARSPLEPGVLADHVGALLAINAGEGLHARKAELAMLAKIHACIRERCEEKNLTAADVASTLHISPRALHRALAGVGETFATALTRARAG